MPERAEQGRGQMGGGARRNERMSGGTAKRELKGGGPCGREIWRMEIVQWRNNEKAGLL